MSKNEIIENEKINKIFISYMHEFIDDTIKNKKKLNLDEKKAFSEFLEIYTVRFKDDFDILIKKDDVQTLSSNLRYLYQYVEKIDWYASEQDEFYLYLLGFFTGTYQSYADSLSIYNEEEIFQTKMAQIIERAHVKSVLFYVYEHENVQHKKICDAINITPSQVNRIMNVLTDINCMTVIELGKYKFYNLTQLGKKYIKINLGYNEKLIVETSSVIERMPSKPELVMDESDVSICRNRMRSDEEELVLDNNKFICMRG